MLHSKARERRSKAKTQQFATHVSLPFPSHGLECICAPHSKETGKAGTRLNKWVLWLHLEPVLLLSTFRKARFSFGFSLCYDKIPRGLLGHAKRIRVK